MSVISRFLGNSRDDDGRHARASRTSGRCSIFDMYGDGARLTEARLEHAFTRRRGHDPARLAVHRAAYAIVTATCFSASGSDGHFAWCVAMLQRPDVRAALA